jgi:hypothetical protein
MPTSGDLSAAKLILGYTICPPTIAPDPDILDELELKNKAGYNKAEREAQVSKPSITDRILWDRNL